MKTILKVFVVALMLILVNNISAQTIREKKQVQLLSKEISSLNKEIRNLQNSLLFDYSLDITELYKVNSLLILRLKSEVDSLRVQNIQDSLKMCKKRIKILEMETIPVDRAEVALEISNKKRRAQDLENEKDNIFVRYSTSRALPDELTRKERIIRTRTNVVRRDDLVLRKIENNISSSSSAMIDPSGSNSGYKIILANDYATPISFVINPVNGGEKKVVLLEARTKMNVYLISGMYLVSFNKGGTQFGESRPLTVNGVVHVYKGEECFGFAYMPRY